jgi:hypothetical protein
LKVDLGTEQWSFYFLPNQSALSKKRVTLTILFTIIIVSCFASSLDLASASAETSIAIANSSINNAYTNVLAAEKAGGNITDLLNKLNVAADLLVQAENNLRNGDSTEVISKAESSRQIADKVNEAAIKLLNDQLVHLTKSFWLTIAFSVVGVSVFVFVLWLVWRQFKRRFMTKLLDMKPEVLKDAS